MYYYFTSPLPSQFFSISLAHRKKDTYFLKNKGFDTSFPHSSVTFMLVFLFQYCDGRFQKELGMHSSSSAIQCRTRIGETDR